MISTGASCIVACDVPDVGDKRRGDGRSRRVMRRFLDDA